MQISIPISWAAPGPTLTDNAVVEFVEGKTEQGYYIRLFTEKDITWPKGFPDELKDAYFKPLYHKLNVERQKVVLDDVSDSAVTK